MNRLSLALVAAISFQAAGDEPRADIADLAWLEGCWQGTGFGATVSECWMSAPDGRLTGMFQVVGEEGQQFSEIFILDDFEDGPAIRLKHFNPDLTGWEAQDEYVVFELLETGENFARFDALTYRRDEMGRLVVEVVLTDGDTRRTERLVFERAPSIDP